MSNVKSKDKIRQSIQISIEYGSEFQRKTWDECISLTMEQFKKCVELGHKDNKINIINSYYKNNPME